MFCQRCSLLPCLDFLSVFVSLLMWNSLVCKGYTGDALKQRVLVLMHFYFYNLVQTLLFSTNRSRLVTSWDNAYFIIHVGYLQQIQTGSHHLYLPFKSFFAQSVAVMVIARILQEVIHEKLRILNTASACVNRNMKVLYCWNCYKSIFLGLMCTCKRACARI
jgi:hypothetical protein